MGSKCHLRGPEEVLSGTMWLTTICTCHLANVTSLRALPGTGIVKEELPLRINQQMFEAKEKRKQSHLAQPCVLLPWARHGPWTPRRWSWVSECRDRGLGSGEKWVRKLQLCWAQTIAGCVLQQRPEYYAILQHQTVMSPDSLKSLTEELEKLTNRSLWARSRNLPVIFTALAKDTFASPAALSKAL